MSLHGGPPRHREWKIGCKVYIGNLAEGASKADIEDAFSKYGPLRNVWVARNPPGFAFVEFEDSRDAEDACRHLDGTRIAGARIKAEMSHGRSRRGRGGGGGPPGFRGGHPHHPMMSPYGGHGGGGGGGRGPYGGPPPYGGGGGIHGGSAGRGGHHLDRTPRERHAPRPRSPTEFRHYSRSRSNSLGRSPPPPPQQRTDRPRTPPSPRLSKFT